MALIIKLVIPCRIVITITRCICLATWLSGWVYVQGQFFNMQRASHKQSCVAGRCGLQPLNAFSAINLYYGFSSLSAIFQNPEKFEKRNQQPAFSEGALKKWSQVTACTCVCIQTTGTLQYGKFKPSFLSMHAFSDSCRRACACSGCCTNSTGLL